MKWELSGFLHGENEKTATEKTKIIPVKMISQTT